MRLSTNKEFYENENEKIKLKRLLQFRLTKANTMTLLLKRLRSMLTRKQRYRKMRSNHSNGDVDVHSRNQKQNNSFLARIDGQRLHRRRAFCHEELFKDFQRLKLIIVKENLKKSGLC